MKSRMTSAWTSWRHHVTRLVLFTTEFQRAEAQHCGHSSLVWPPKTIFLSFTRETISIKYSTKQNSEPLCPKSMTSRPVYTVQGGCTRDMCISLIFQSLDFQIQFTSIWFETRSIGSHLLFISSGHPRWETCRIGTKKHEIWSVPLIMNDVNCNNLFMNIHYIARPNSEAWSCDERVLFQTLDECVERNLPVCTQQRQTDFHITRFFCGHDSSCRCVTLQTLGHVTHLYRHYMYKAAKGW